MGAVPIVQLEPPVDIPHCKALATAASMRMLRVVVKIESVIQIEVW